ncbi:MAG: SLOG family protein [Dysosmobacter sp.]|nr:SLOG family protein [Dysosmobacter sp.]
MTEKTCCVTGHREIPDDKQAYVEAELKKEILAAVADGYTRFISGFAEGADLTFAAIVAELKEQNPILFLEAAIPYAGRLKSKDQTFQKLITVCNGIKVLCAKYSPNCFFIRNRYMVGESSRVIAVYDGRERGGTLFTMRCAHAQGKEVRVIKV